MAAMHFFDREPDLVSVIFRLKRHHGPTYETLPSQRQCSFPSHVGTGATSCDQL